MNLAIKLSLHLPEDENIQNLMTYVLEMARYDMDTDLRDRSRFMTSMMGELYPLKLCCLYTDVALLHHHY